MAERTAHCLLALILSIVPFLCVCSILTVTFYASMDSPFFFLESFLFPLFSRLLSIVLYQIQSCQLIFAAMCLFCSFNCDFSNAYTFICVRPSSMLIFTNLYLSLSPPRSFHS